MSRSSIRNQYQRVIVLSAMVAALLCSVNPANSQSTDWCEGFEDGSGFASRWTSVEGSIQYSVGDPVLEGDSCFAFGNAVGGGKFLSAVFRTGFEGGFGEYSAWIRVGDAEGANLFAEVQPDPDEYPTWAPGYNLSIWPVGAPSPYVKIARHTGLGSQGDWVLFDSLPATFGPDEWIRGFLRIFPNGLIVGGYEQNGSVYSVVCHDPDPIEGNGRFYLAAITRFSQPAYFDDVCYSEFPIGCFDRHGDMNCDGVADNVDLNTLINHIFFNGMIPPCTSDPLGP